MSGARLASPLMVLALAASACNGDQPAADTDTTPSPTTAAAPDPTEAPAEPSPPLTTGLEFAAGHRLRILGAEPSRSDLPVVVVLRPSDHVDLGAFLPTLASEGVLVFDAPWRPIEQGGRYPTVLEEASCAVGFARDHATEYGGDPTTVTLVAHSAGSYVAALASFGSYEGDCTSSADTPEIFATASGEFSGFRICAFQASNESRSQRS